MPKLFGSRGLLAALLLVAGCQTASESITSAGNPRQPQGQGPGSVVLFVGDGMGISTITAARIYAGQKLGLPGEEHSLSFESFPELALIKTYNTDLQVPDSAGTMSALVTGYKTRAGVLSIPPSVVRGNCEQALAAPLPTLLEEAEALGLRTGLVSTARLTHATPAANFAHSADRNWEDDSMVPAPAQDAGCLDIARQFAEFAGGDGVDIALAGGRGNFLPKGAADPESGEALGRRLDGRDLTADWLAAGAGRRYVWNRAALEAAAADPATTQILGLFESSHMQYEADRDAALEPSLAEMSVLALKRLKAGNDRGFYLVIEGGRIDHAHHEGNAYRALEDTVAFDAAVAAVLAEVDLANTLVLVTADHSHTLTMSGYPSRGNPILGKVRLPNGELLLGADGKPYTTLGYANGPGAVTGSSAGAGADRPDLTAVDTEDPDFKQQALVPGVIETHGGEDVAAFAIGRNAEAVRGVMDQHELHVVMRDVIFAGAER